MRNGLIGLGTAITFTTIIVTGACANDDSNGAAGTGGAAASTVGGSAAVGGNTATGGNAAANGGQTASGGSGTASGGASTGVGGGTASCTDVTPCGGNIVGTWTVKSSCLKVAGEADLTFAGIGCTSAAVTGTHQVTGTWTTTADGKVTDSTTTKGEEKLVLAAGCLNVSGTTTTCDRLGNTLRSMGYSAVTCTNAASGGGCECNATLDQTGGIGVLSMYPITTGNYTTANNVVTTTDGVENTPYSYCVSGNTLTLTPDNTTITGSIVLEKP